MEMKKSTNTTVNITSTIDNFPWPALHLSSKNMDIISAINQLLSMYHPDDGMIAYERVIKTLLILSENWDSNTRQQILSVIPFPKGVPNDKIRNLMYETTELVNAANNISTCEKVTIAPEDKLNIEIVKKNSEIYLNQNMLLDVPQHFELNEKLASTIPEVFKGFPPNEISTIHSHLSIDRDHNGNQSNITNISHRTHQDIMRLNKKLFRSNIITNQQIKYDALNVEETHNDKLTVPKENYGILNNNVNGNNKKHNNDKNVNTNKNHGIETQYLGPELRDEQYAIQQDIYKMDIVYWDEEQSDKTSSAQALQEDEFVMENFIIRAKLKTGLQNFLKRAEQDILVEFPIMSRTKPMLEVPSTSKSWQFVNQKNLENNNQLGVSNNNLINYKNIDATESITKIIEKKSPISSRHIYSKSAQLQLLHKNLNATVNKAQILECKKKDNVENLLHKSAVKQAKEKGLNALQQTTSITELSTFKRRYYDTLLNIQKAKMAVANSLRISSIESCTKYEPYYSNHSYQQQHGSLTVNPQFTVHTMAQSGLPSIYNAPYTMMRYNNWKHPSMKQLRLAQFPFHISRNKE